MRFLGVALVSSAVVLGACGGDAKQDAASAAASTPAAAAPGGAPAAAPAVTGAALPITGKTWEVKMVGDGNAYKFEPADLTIKAGDGIKFTVVSVPPHNVAFDPALVPADVKAQLDANMGPNKLGELSSGLMLAIGDAVTISFAGIKPGKYEFHCTPHIAMNMKGTVTVTP
jgi:plastocyanin